VDGDKNASVEPRITGGKSSVAGVVIQFHCVSILEAGALLSPFPDIIIRNFAVFGHDLHSRRTIADAFATPGRFPHPQATTA
jgi:hypothetical protein